MRFSAAFLLVVILPPLVVADQGKDDAKNEVKKLQGTWLMTSEDGKETAPEEERVVIAGEKLTMYVGGKVFREFSFTLDPSAAPKRIDLTRTKDDGKPTTALGIYDIKGEVLRICAPANVGGERPKEFKKVAMSQEMLHMKRKKN